ncbi:MAG: site-specific DNA-methyltransferase [Bacteroidales bacterium]|jgi:DNA modification methylase|nr:site-specific DNA-methyltransferase [Bacteroidales bacterium]
MNLYNDDYINVINSFGKVDLILTDPPYEIANEGGGMMKTKKCRVFLKQVDEMDMCEGFDIKEFLNLTLPLFKSKEHYNGVYFCSRLQLYDYITFAVENKLQYGIMVWHKTDPPPLCNNKYLNDVEFIIYIKGNKVKIYGDYHTKSLVYRSTINRKDKELYEHPTIKPLELINKLVINHSKENDIVFDPFMGSGTTGASCSLLGRDFIGVELTEKYFDIAKKRIEGTRKVDLSTLF